MGNSLHNKIYLGRRVRGCNSRGIAALLLLGMLTCSGLFWLGLRALG